MDPGRSKHWGHSGLPLVKTCIIFIYIIYIMCIHVSILI